MVFDDQECFVAWNESYGGEISLTKRSYHDVAELCGGAGGTGTLLVRRGWGKGPSFDIIVALDLMKQTTNMSFLRYLKVSRLTVLIISTPCTGMKGFIAINLGKSRAAWLISRRMSTPLANLVRRPSCRCMRDGTSLPNSLRDSTCGPWTSGSTLPA